MAYLTKYSIAYFTLIKLNHWKWRKNVIGYFPLWQKLKANTSNLKQPYFLKFIYFAGLEDSQARIKIFRRNISSLRHADYNTLMAESEEELKSLLMKMKEESEKAGLKLNMQNTKIMASSYITLWQIDEENVETVSDFILLVSRIMQTVTAAMKFKDTCSLEE